MTYLKAIRNLQRHMAKEGFEPRAIAAKIMRNFGRRSRAAWRLAHGLTQVEAADRYNALFGADGRAPMTSTRLSAYERWPEGGERPTPNTVCRLAELYGACPADLIDDLDLGHVPMSDREVLRSLLRDDRREEPAAVAVRASEPGITYGREQDEQDDSDNPEEVVMAAAHEGSERAEEAERRDIGDATLEQLRADVVRLSRDFLAGEPFSAFRQMRRVRRRIYTALDRRLWPRDESELYFLVGCLNGLMALAACELGNRQAAEQLVRAGWAYATAIDHRALMGHLRDKLVYITHWQRPRQSRELARDGLRYLPDGPNAALLHFDYASAAVHLGDAAAARRAISEAHEARARDHHDEVLEIGGEFNVSQATHHFEAGSVLVDVSGAEREAIGELEEAIRLYTGPEPEEGYHQICVTGSRIELAIALLRGGELDGAASALEPVLSLPPERRADTPLRRFQRVRGELAAPRYQGSTQAAGLDESIESFCQETIVGDLGGIAAEAR